MKKFGVKEVVAAAICAALVFVLLKWVAIPTPLPDTTLSIYAAIVAFFSILFGPIVGFVGGFVGNLMVDVTAGWGIWWSWIIPTGVYGLLMGIACRKIKLNDGIFGMKDTLRLIIADIISALICWGVLAPVGDIVFYQEPANKVFLQGLFIGISAIVSTAIVTSILCKAYAASKAKAGSLKKED